MNFCYFTGIKSLATSDITTFADSYLEQLLAKRHHQLALKHKHILKTLVESVLCCSQGIKCFFKSCHKASFQFEFLFCLLWKLDLTSLALDHFPLLVTFTRRKTGRTTTPQNFYWFICCGTLTCKKGCRFINSEQVSQEMCRRAEVRPFMSSYPILILHQWFCWSLWHKISYPWKRFTHILRAFFNLPLPHSFT